jgi:signal transduction histidine kinase
MACNKMSRRLLILLLLGIVLTEVAILVPVIILAKQYDAATGRARLDEVNSRFITGVRDKLESLLYNTARTAATATFIVNMTRDALAKSVLRPLNPSRSDEELFAWVPRVKLDERAAYEAENGPIIELHANGSGFQYAVARPEYYPYTFFEPVTPYATFIKGFDMLSDPRSSRYLTGQPLHIVPHSGLNQTRPFSFGIAFVAHEETGKGYALGVTSMEDILTSSLVVASTDVSMAAFDASVSNDFQLLYRGPSPVMGNVTTYAELSTLPRYSEFFVSNITLLGDDIVVAVLYRAAARDTYTTQGWVGLTAILVPVCVVIDSIVVVMLLVWRQRGKDQQRERQMRESSQLLLAYVNHEIRNPLQTILGLGDLWLDELKAADPRNDRLVDDLETMVSSAEFVEHIATDILDVRRIEEGRISLDIGEISVEAMVSRLHKSVVAHAKPGVVFDVVCEEGAPSVIRTDRYRLEQILMNFVSNAFKHTERGSVVVRFSAPAGDRFRVSVADTGRGIPAERQALVFQEYAQMEVSDATLRGGFGLGLYLTKMLARLLGGSVGFTSQEGLGSTFCVELPLDPDWRQQFDTWAIPLTAS